MGRDLYYPIFLDLRGKRVLVAGGGKVALRKARALVEAGAHVSVVAPRWEPEFETLPVRLCRRKFRASDLRGMFLVFTATDDRAVNHRVATEAKRRGIPVNVADNAAECDFLLPARVRSGNLQVAVSTGGRSPRLAVELRRRIQAILDARAGTSLE